MHCSRTANAALQAIYAFNAVLAMLETRPKLCQRDDLYKRKHCDECASLFNGMN